MIIIKKILSALKKGYKKPKEIQHYIDYSKKAKEYQHPFIKHDGGYGFPLV